MSPTIPDIAGVLLAGEKSRRMGRDKRFIDVGGRTLVERASEVFKQLFSEILIVAAEPTAALLALGPVVTDTFPDRGSLGGLYTGLSRASRNRVFAAACDMPFLDPAVIAFMATFDRQADIVIPRLSTGLQPLHAIYAKNCLPDLHRMICAGNLKLHELVESRSLLVKVIPEEQIRSIDPRLISFMNVNRPADLEFAYKVNAGLRTSPGNDA